MEKMSNIEKKNWLNTAGLLILSLALSNCGIVSNIENDVEETSTGVHIVKLDEIVTISDKGMHLKVTAETTSIEYDDANIAFYNNGTLILLTERKSIGGEIGQIQLGKAGLTSDDNVRDIVPVYVDFGD
jgi:hypothetical protein